MWLSSQVSQTHESGGRSSGWFVWACGCFMWACRVECDCLRCAVLCCSLGCWRFERSIRLHKTYEGYDKNLKTPQKWRNSPKGQQKSRKVSTFSLFYWKEGKILFRRALLFHVILNSIQSVIERSNFRRPKLWHGTVHFRWSRPTWCACMNYSCACMDRLFDWFLESWVWDACVVIAIQEHFFKNT